MKLEDFEYLLFIKSDNANIFMDIFRSIGISAKKMLPSGRILVMRIRIAVNGGSYYGVVLGKKKDRAIDQSKWIDFINSEKERIGFSFLWFDGKQFVDFSNKKIFPKEGIDLIEY